MTNLFELVLAGRFHSRYRGLLLTDELPADAPEGYDADAWATVREAQAEVRQAEKPGERRAAVAKFTEAVDWLPTAAPNAAAVASMDRFYLREALHWYGDTAARRRDKSRHSEVHELEEAWEAWAQHEDWNERDWAYQYFVVGLSPEDARTESAAARERGRRETTIEKVREYNIGEGDPFWGNRPVEERHELILAVGRQDAVGRGSSLATEQSS